MHWRFRALGVSVEVSSSAAPLDALLGANLGAYAPHTGPADLRYEISGSAKGFRLRRDGSERFESESKGELLDFFLMDLYRRLTLGDGKSWYLHAAAIEWRGRSVVLAGPSGAGKSTQCRGLLRRGWGYLSEEVVRLSSDGLDALSRPLHGDSRDLPELPVTWKALPLPHHEGCWIAPVPARKAKSQPQPTLAAMVRLSIGKGGPGRLTRLDAAGALAALWPCRMTSGLEVAKLAASITASTPCYELIAGAPEEATELIAQLVER